MEQKELDIEINKWFSVNYQHLRNEVSNNIANAGMSDYCDDLLNICVLSFLNRSFESKLQMLQDNKIENFILRCCSLQIKSGTSPFYHTYRKHYTHHQPYAEFVHDDMVIDEPYDNSGETLRGCVNIEISKLNWYEARLIELKFYEKMTYDEINKTFRLPLSTLKTEYKRIFEKIKNKCSNC